MALTFGFALIGAMFLCLTWIPVACSLFLNPKKLKAKNISTKILDKVKKAYIPSVSWALNHTKAVVISALIIVALAVFTFTKMGGEFVPTLDEGDFVIQPILKTGKSLSSTIERTSEIEKILLDNFPEVTQVVSRIGAAEVPTDPMSMQDSDVIIRLKPKDEWTSAETKEELANKFKEALTVIPGMEIEFTQPIEMRFNELITGVRSDIAIKIFGEDLDILADKGNEVQNLIRDVEGAADISVEKIVGLPQMAVNFNRSKIARYGLNIEDLNNIIAAGFAGKKTGVVFEGEKRFDMVVRLQEDKREDISDLQNLVIDTPNAGKIPLSEVADIIYAKGPAKISRDETKRRIVVGVNVRNRDLASVVEDIQLILEDNLSLPVGYTMTYGGQFENLQSATRRLQITVPIVLILIFVMLYFALRDYKDALLIFTAIPFSAVGGVFLLWIRDMPFSISAGVGFIALFGIAVLNGIILVEYFKDLQNDNRELNKDNIIEATLDRLRAVLLTASSTALGFLPMAISTGAGAEVQRPLATVVIGGLITSTLLTLIILPVLYYIFEGKSKKIKMPKTTILVLLFGLGGLFSSQAQNPELDKLKAEMLANNKGLNASKINIDRSEAAEGQAFTFDKAQIYQNYDESEADPIASRPLYQWGIIQNFDFPTVYNSRLKLNKVTTELAATNYSIDERMKLKNLEISYMEYSIIKERLQIYSYLDSIYKDFSRMARRKFEEGESSYLEKITAQSKQKQIEAQLVKIRNELVNASNQIRTIVQSDVELTIEGETPHRLTLNNLNSIENLPDFILSELQTQQAKRSEQLAKNELLPGISASYFIRSNSSIDKNFEGYQIGLNIPLLFFGNRSKIKARQLENEMMAVAQQETKIQLEQKQRTLINSLSSQDQTLATYENGQLKVADEIFKTANLSFKNGEIDFFRFVQSLETAQQIKLEYLQQLIDFNFTIISLNYLTLN
jgi:cobalt-zinc-cadmium resistance protein CzcA